MCDERPPGYFTEDLQPREISGPPRYTSRTDKAIEILAIADLQGVVVGYLYACDEDDAAGWQGRPAAGFEAQNLAAPWMRRLRDAKARGLRPTEAFDDLLRAGTDNPTAPRSRAVAGSRQRISGLAALKALAGDVNAEGPPRRS